VRVAAVLLGLALSTARGQVVISQVYGGGGNTGATLRNDFIELFNRGAEPVNITGWTMQYASATGSAWQTTALSGTIAPGQYYLVQQAAGAGGTAALPAPDATGAIAMSATAAKVALVRDAQPLSVAAPTGAMIADLVGYGMTDFAEGQPAAQLSNTTAALRRSGGCIDTNDNRADFQIAAPNPRNSSSPLNVCGAAPPPTSAAISAIQGSGPLSPLAGQTVTTTGIMTARRSNGFFLQSAEPDSDQDTSEGLFVFTSTAPPAAAAPGALVRVTGMVAEFRPAADQFSPTLTELTGPQVEVLSTGHTLPEPVLLNRALLSAGGTIDQLERFEGMRVRLDALRVVGPTGGTRNEANATSSTNGVFWGVLDGVPRPFREPGVEAPNPLPENAPRFDANPERLRVDSDAQPGAPALEVATSAIVRNLTGVLDYGARAYTILPDPGSRPEAAGGAAAQPLIPPSPQEFTVASMNLRRFFDTTDDPATADPVLTPAAFDRRLAKTALAIRDLLRLPDIIAVQEAENLAALEALAARLGGYRAYLEEGNDIGGIDVGFLVKTARVTVLDVTQAGKADTYTTPSGSRATLHDRPPLILRARIGDLTITAIVVHQRSLIDVEDLTVQAKRRAQADAVAALVRARLAANPSENLLVLGDFNAYPFDDGYVDVLGRLRASSDLVLLGDRLPREQSYSYVEDGNAQALDHILIHRNLFGRWSRYTVARINADFPESLAGDAARPERVSDHDFPVAYFALAPQRITAAGVTNAASFLGGAVAPGEFVSLFGGGIGPEAPDRAATRVEFDGVEAPVFYAQARQVNAMAPLAIAGRTTTTLRVTHQGQSSEVVLPVLPSVPGVFVVANETGELNRPERPAAPGSTLRVFLTAAAELPVTVTADGRDLEIVYTASAPGLLYMEARLPMDLRAGDLPLFVTVGDHGSQDGVRVSVR